MQSPDGQPLTFRQFIEAPYPVGIGSDVETIRKLTRFRSRWEGVPEERESIDQMRREIERLLLEPVNTLGTNQHRVGGDNITPTAERGTSREYTLRFLKRDRPDLAERVISGELSANAAAIQAGIPQASYAR